MSTLNGIQFGSGLMFATPTSGNLATNPTAQEVGVIQDIKLTLGAEIKSLYGQFQWPVDTAVAKRSIKGSISFAQLTNSFLSQMFFSDNVAPGVISTAYREAHSIPATPFTVTVANSTKWVRDEGVLNATTGTAFTQVASAPAAGQYSVAAGVYTFAAADTGTAVTISYDYTVAATGTTLTVGNHVMGWGPVVQLVIPFQYQGGNSSIVLPNTRLGKIDITTKLDDYTKLTADFESFAGAGNNPLNIYNVQ